MYQTHSNILEIIDLGLHLNLPHGRYHALKNISFDIKESQTLALVGESGSGKTLIAQAIMGLLPDIAQFTNGKILFYDRLADKTQTAQYEPMNLAQLNPLSKQYQQLRGGKISIIFQEPMTSLSSMHTIGDQITEAICLHHPENSIIQAREIAAEMLAYCGFKQPTGSLKKYPFELSGGLRQRVMIAMA
ncbi:MAG: ATP-binding cassette domain-containing protein, partial [Pseudomonadota bacterium]